MCQGKPGSDGGRARGRAQSPLTLDRDNDDGPGRPGGNGERARGRAQSSLPMDRTRLTGVPREVRQQWGARRRARSPMMPGLLGPSSSLRSSARGLKARPRARSPLLPGLPGHTCDPAVQGGVGRSIARPSLRSLWGLVFDDSCTHDGLEEPLEARIRQQFRARWPGGASGG